MLVTFSSKAGADILMLGPHAKTLLKIIGKSEDKDLLTRGVIMPNQIDAAITQLTQAIAAQPKHEPQDQEEETELRRDPLSIPVGLAQRAYPLIDLLKRAQTQNVPVLWEAGSGW